MVKEGLTEIVCILDRSGSMHSIKSAALEGLNGFIKSQQECNSGEANFTLATFSDDYLLEIDNKPIQEVNPITDYNCDGCTALFDAVGKTINAVGDRLSNLPEDERPSKVIVTIQTDGMENSSKEFSGEQVREMVKHQTDKYSWDFIFLSAGLDAESAGLNLGISKENIFGFDATVSGLNGVYSGMQSYCCSSRSGSDTSHSYESLTHY